MSLNQLEHARSLILRSHGGIVTFVAVIRHLIWLLALVVKGDLEVVEKGWRWRGGGDQMNKIRDVAEEVNVVRGKQ